MSQGSTFALTGWLFRRLLGLVYLAAFASDSLGRMRVQVLTHTGQKLARMRQERIDLVARDSHFRAVVHGLPAQERFVKPPRVLLTEDRRLHEYLVELGGEGVTEAGEGVRLRTADDRND